jgi:hypothetical protein
MVTRLFGATLPARTRDGKIVNQLDGRNQKFLNHIQNHQLNQLSQNQLSVQRDAQETNAKDTEVDKLKLSLEELA